MYEERKYDEATDLFIDAFESSKASRFQIHNAIKVSGLIDFEFLKKLNKMHQDVDTIFNLAVEETKKYYDQDILSEENSEDSNIEKKLKVKSTFFNPEKRYRSLQIRDVRRLH